MQPPLIHTSSPPLRGAGSGDEDFAGGEIDPGETSFAKAPVPLASSALSLTIPPPTAQTTRIRATSPSPFAPSAPGQQQLPPPPPHPPVPPPSSFAGASTTATTGAVAPTPPLGKPPPYTGTILGGVAAAPAGPRASILRQSQARLRASTPANPTATPLVRATSLPPLPEGGGADAQSEAMQPRVDVSTAGDPASVNGWEERQGWAVM